MSTSRAIDAGLSEQSVVAALGSIVASEWRCDGTVEPEEPAPERLIEEAETSVERLGVGGSDEIDRRDSFLPIPVEQCRQDEAAVARPRRSDLVSIDCTYPQRPLGLWSLGRR